MAYSERDIIDPPNNHYVQAMLANVVVTGNVVRQIDTEEATDLGTRHERLVIKIFSIAFGEPEDSHNGEMLATAQVIEPSNRGTQIVSISPDLDRPHARTRAIITVPDQSPALEDFSGPVIGN